MTMKRFPVCEMCFRNYESRPAPFVVSNPHIHEVIFVCHYHRDVAIENGWAIEVVSDYLEREYTKRFKRLERKPEPPQNPFRGPEPGE